MKKQKGMRVSYIGLTNGGGFFMVHRDIEIIGSKKCIEHIKRVEREV
jgi:hypothetical protein